MPLRRSTVHELRLERYEDGVVALDLLKNYGQHHANLAGLRESSGDYVITMDDDLQNPPDQALLLIDEAMTGKDLVFGEFATKQAAGYRRLGSKLISKKQRQVQPEPVTSGKIPVMHGSYRCSSCLRAWLSWFT